MRIQIIIRTLIRDITLLVIVVLGLPAPTLAANGSYLDAAQQAAKWIQQNSIVVDDGLVWPSDPRDPKSVNTTLYHGIPGPILFFLEMYRTTGRADHLKSARMGADGLVSSIQSQKEPGLYEGLAGTGFTLGQAYLITHETKYRDAAFECVKRLQQTTQKTRRGVVWNDTTDIIAGSAGIGLFLLWADHILHAPGARELAIQAGLHLIDLGHDSGLGQLRWKMDSKFPKEMPNFSHGTAGVAYFLATLYQETKQRAFLKAALAGAKYLQSIAGESDVCLIEHDDSAEGRQLYYLGWCHGPPGTARLFYRLYQVTSDRSWLKWMKKSARALVVNGAPDKVVTPGTWDNVSVCCGVTAQAQFFLNMYQVTRDRKYLRLAVKASDLLVAKAVRDNKGLRWVQAEHLVKPELLVAQTGYMQGASGVGMWLLHLSEFMKHSRKPVITLPDNPFVY